LKSESSNLIKELAVFLEEKANVKVETTANEIPGRRKITGVSLSKQEKGHTNSQD
jgi:hypothetical protein